MRMNKISLACVVLGSSALLAACGGGGGDGDATLTLKGTAAVGAPLVGAVTATCKTGTGSATSNSDGTYTVAIVGGVGPCLLKIQPATGATLYSITSGSGATQTANITPMTNMLVTYLLNVPGMKAATPEAWFAQPVVKTLLTDTTGLSTRITRDFLPALKTLLPTLSVANTDFLFMAFVANPAASAADADLEKLKTAGVVTSTGAPSAAAASALATSAANDTPVVGATGATGAGS